LTISPVKDADGHVVGASKVARDITKRLQQEEAIRVANAALGRANADLQQFAYSASHDLQEPLRMVAAYSELLQKRFGVQLGESAEEYIRYIVEGASRMEALLRGLRTYMRVSTTEHEPDTEVDAEAVLKKTLASLEVAIKESGAAVISTPLPRVRMFEFQLHQVFQNLIGNAIRYRRSNAPRINVSAEQRGHEWLFSVQDNGIGIEPQFKEKIFGIFKRLHNSAEYPGTGMGLAICERIIERAGGRIWVESEPGCGSTFFFTVPCGRS
jgi:light-regulated signal transduction histidine kinase (bacteriophytochrome)